MAHLKRQRDALQRKRDEQALELKRRTRELTQHARGLVRTNQALRETVDENTTLLQTVVHDLKNPLFGIWALSEVVLESGALSQEAEHKIRLIHQSAADGQDRIDDLLSSAAEMHETGRNASIVDMGAVVQRVVHRFEAQAEWKRQQLHCSVEVSAPCLVDGDRRELQDALSNLLSNALKYSPPEARIDVILERTGDNVRIAIVDEGPGLSDEEQQCLFAPFQRLSPNPTGGESASGLGLYLVKQIVDRHHGRVDVDSSPGEGSTFTLVLPASKAPPIGHTQGELLSSAVLEQPPASSDIRGQLESYLEE
jgi:signal transduction histidine kinase